MADQPSPSDYAEEIFTRHLADSEAGKGASFDAVLTAHPEIADELSALWDEWQRLQPLREILDSGESGWNPLAGFTEMGGEPCGPEDAIAHLQKRSKAIDRYRFQSEIGRGGMGVVLKVLDQDLQRELAMKVMRPGDRASKTSEVHRTRSLNRFFKEARITGQLDHPSIVPVHDIGVDAKGQVYFTMKLVIGRELTHVLELVKQGDSGWTRTRALNVLLKVCQAMAYAHSKGIVHRDLKPANVMVGSFGAVYVMDWGLARTADAMDEEETKFQSYPVAESTVSGSSFLTEDGEVMGTPAYMSPEQASGRHSEVGPATDVYAVGSMLYHLLSGKPPFVDPGQGKNTVLNRARAEQPKAIELLDATVPAELIAITEKAMAREAAGRYPSMKELGDDLRAYLEGRVVRAHEVGPWVQLRKWVARNRQLAAAICVGLVMTLVGLAGIAWFQTEARAQEKASSARLSDSYVELEEANTRAVQNEALATQRALQADRQREVADRVAGFLVGLFRSSDPAEARGRKVTAEELLERGVTAIETEELSTPVRAALLKTMGQAYISLGKYKTGKELVVEGLHQHATGGEPLDLEERIELTAVALRAGALADEPGSLEQLEELQEEALRHLGAKHPATIQIRYDVVQARSIALDYTGDIGIIDEFMQDVADVGGTANQLYLSLLDTRAKHLASAGLYTEAGQAFRESLERGIAANGQDDPGTITARNALVGFYLNSGDSVRAVALGEETLELAERVLGVDHPTYSSILFRLAEAYRHAGRFDEAETMLLDSLQLTIDTLGEDHRDTLTAYFSMSELYLKMGRLEAAEEFARHAHQGSLAKHGEDHHLVIASLNNLGQVAAAQGNSELAIERWIEAAAMARKNLGLLHPLRENVLWNLTRSYDQNGRTQEALSLVEEVVEGLPASHPRHEAWAQRLERYRKRLGAEASD